MLRSQQDVEIKNPSQIVKAHRCTPSIIMRMSMPTCICAICSFFKGSLRRRELRKASTERKVPLR